MSKIFKSIAKVLGPILLFIPGLNVVGAALIVGSTAMDVVQQRRQKKAAQRALESAGSSQTLTFKSPLASRRIIYGRTRTGGILYPISISSDNKYFYIIVIFGDGPNESIDDIYFNDEIVTLDGSAESTTLNGTGKWAGKVRLQKHFGGTTQAADSDFVTDTSTTGWTIGHQLKGICYIALRLTFDPGVFPNGLPNISAVIRGRNDIQDGRSSTGYKVTPPLCLAHYLSLEKLGPNIDWTNEIDQTALNTAANDCEDEIALSAAGNFSTTVGTDANRINSTDHGLHDSQIVNFTSTTTLPAGLSAGTDYYVINADKDSFEVTTSIDDVASIVTMTNDGTGTHSFTAAERRFTFGGVVDTDNSPEDIMRQFRDSMAGTVAYIGGKWTMTAGVYQTPTFTIDEDILAGPIKIKPKRGRRERFNVVKGFFLAAQNRWQAADYPPVTNATYVAEDGEELLQGLDLLATSTPSMANRIAKILLEKSRKEFSLELTCNIEALKAQAGQTVLVSLPRYNITSMPFDVDGFNLEVANGVVLVHLSLSQTASNVYTWTAGSDEQTFTVFDEPVLPDGLPDSPTGLTLTNNLDARDLVSVFLQWDATTDEFILQGGLVVVEWKKSSAADTDWQSITGSPASIEYTVRGLEPDVNYDFRIAWRNKFGGQSPYAEELAHTTRAAASSAYNYKHTQSTPATTWTIVHDLGYRPSIGAIFDHNDDLVKGDEATGTLGDPTGESEIEITFVSAIYGTAYLS